MNQNEHGQILAYAANAHLLPLGCRRKGQSRFWFCDQSFWLIGVEFQPSSWSRGSYLNAWVQWLWRAKTHFTYDSTLDDHGHRLANFAPYKTDEQFSNQMHLLAEQAAEAVLALRAKFSTLDAIATALRFAAKHRSGWPVFHAAVAAGLAGDMAGAHRLLSAIASEPIHYEWQAELRQKADRLLSVAGDSAAYRRIILERVARSRALKRLRPDTGCFEEAL